MMWIVSQLWKERKDIDQFKATLDAFSLFFILFFLRKFFTMYNMTWWQSYYPFYLDSIYHEYFFIMKWWSWKIF